MSRVLIADDDLDLLESLADEFADWGCHVTLAQNGADLMKRLSHEEPYDLVVTDVSMPLLDGLHVAHTARYVGVDTPVIVMSALRDRDLEERVMKIGPNVAFLRKPFTTEKLRHVAQHLIT